MFALHLVYVMMGMLCLTCICQAISGGGGGQHLPAPISAVLDAAVCTFYCKNKGSGSFILQLTDITH